MTYRDDLRAEPYGFDFFSTLRELERSSRDKPRIGENNVLAEEIVSLGQDPFLEFPASNLTGYEDRPEGAPRDQDAFPGLLRPARSAAAQHDSRCTSLVVAARPFLRSLHRHFRQSLPAALLPRMVGRTPDRAGRPPGRGSLHPFRRLVHGDRHRRLPRARQTGGHRQGLVRRPDRLADQERRHGSGN